MNNDNLIGALRALLRQNDTSINNTSMANLPNKSNTLGPNAQINDDGTIRVIETETHDDFVDNYRENSEPSQDAPGSMGYNVDEDTFDYVYKPGDTFGQVILDLGAASDKGLWGDDGDVAYYTQQLAEQGALDANGNIPIGAKIKLRKRPTTDADIAKSENYEGWAMTPDGQYVRANIAQRT